MIFLFLYALQQILAVSKYYDSSTLKSQLIDQNESKNSSIWFKYQNADSQLNIIFVQTDNKDKKEFLSIINSNLEIRFYNQIKSYNVEKYDISDWFHLSISITKPELKLKFHLPFEGSVVFQYNSSFNLLVEQSLQYKCFIYTEFTNNFYQIKQEYEYFKLVRPNLILQLFASHSAFQTFLKRKIWSQLDDVVMSIYTKDLEILIYFYDTIYMIQEQKYNATQYQMDNWFQIIIYFELDQIQIDVVFIDETHTMVQQIYQDNSQKQLFYNIEIYFVFNNIFTIQKSNYYQFYDIEQMENCHPLCQQCENDHCLKCYNDNCDCLQNYYFNQTVNQCILISQQYEIPVTRTKIQCSQGFIYHSNQCRDMCTYYEGSVAKSCYFDEKFSLYNYFSNIEDALLRRVILNIQQDSQYIQVPFDASLPIEQHGVLIDSVLILPKNFIYQIKQQDKLSLCRINYSGIRCQYKLKTCLQGENKQCLFCYLGHYLYKSKCQKCQVNCQVCEYDAKKKIIYCLFPTEGYYINEHGNIRKCSKQCYLCNKMGECISELQILNQQQDLKVDKYQLFDKIIKCPDNFILSLKGQICYQIDSNSNILQYVQSIIEQNQPFLGDYKIPLQEQLIQNLINTDKVQQIFNNDQIEKMLIFNQFKDQLQQKLHGKLSDKEENRLASKGQTCIKKKYHFKELRCSEFKLSGNISQIEQQCFSKHVCKYFLVLQNVSIFTDRAYAIFYEDHEYTNLNQLLNSIQDIGINYGSITINATYYLRSSQEIHYEQNLIIQKDRLKPQLKGIQTILQINFTIQTNRSQPDSMTIFLKADLLLINNTQVYSNYSLHLHIECEILQINNTIILEGNFYLYIVKADSVLIYETSIITDYQMKEVKIITFDYIMEFTIKNFLILQSHLNKNLFQIGQMVAFLQIEDLNIYQSQLFDLQLLQIREAEVVKLMNFNIAQSQFDKSTILWIQTLISLQIQNLQILETTFLISDYQFSLHDGNYLVLNQIFLEKCQFKQSNFILVQSYHLISFQKSRIRLVSAIETIFMNCYADHFKIENIFVDIQDFYTFVMAKIHALNVNLDQFYLRHVGTSINSQQEIDYLFQFTFNQGEFKNIYIDRFELHGQGLILIVNKKEVIVTNITLNKIEIRYLPHKLPYVILFSNFISKVTISQLYIQNAQTISGEAQYIAIIAVIGRFDLLILEKAIISSLYSVSLQNYIFFLSNEETQIHDLIIRKTTNFNFFQVQTKFSQFRKLLFENNQQNLEYFTLNSTAKFNHQVMIIYNTKVLNQNGSFFYSSLFNKLQVDVMIINLYIHGIDTLRLFIVDQVEFNLVNVKIIGYQTDLQKYIYLKQLFSCINSEISILKMTIVNTNILFGEFIKVKSLCIIKLSVTDFHLQEDTYDKVCYLSVVPIFKLILKDIYISDSSLTQIQFMYISTPIDNVKLFNIYFKNFQTDLSIFQFIFVQNSHKINIDRIHFQNVNGEMALLELADETPLLIEIHFNNIFINNCSNPLIMGEYQDVKIQINNSLINLQEHYNHQRIKVDLYQSQIIHRKTLNYQLTLQKNTFIFNEKLLQQITEKELSIRLTFNQGKSFLNIIKYNNSYQIEFDRNPNSYFYLPSGQVINQYKRLYINQLKYEVIYKGFGIFLQGSQNLSCNLTSTYKGEEIEVFNQNELILQQGLNMFDNLTSVINPYNSDYVQNEIQCNNYSLRFNTKGFRCQLGEFFYNNQCLQCDISKGLYSTQYNSTHCFNVNYNQIEQLKIGLIKLRQNYWRYNYSTTYIEQCTNQYYCNGGWRPGDSSCNSSRIGPLCLECDVYNHVGNGHYTKNLNSCQICQVTYTLIYQILFSVIWQLLLTFINVYSKDNLSKQFLFYKVGFSNFYQVLYRLSIDQPSVILKMFLNYIFQIYLIRKNFDYLGQLLVLNINYMNNPNLIIQAQLDCLFIQVQNVEIIYTQFFFTLCNLFFVLSLQYFIYLMLVKFKITTFSIKFFFLATVETVIFNLKIILEISFKLLSYQEISGFKWITSNLAFKFYTPMHKFWMFNYIIPITSILTLTPILSIFLLKLNYNIYRRIQKTFSLFQQAFKNNFFFWEYIIIYVKLLFILISIINSEQLQFTTVLSLSILFIIYHQQPYYLKNLNHIDFRLLFFFTFTTQVLIITNSNFVQCLIFFINIYIVIDVIKLVIRKSIQTNRSIICDYKSQLTNKFPQLKKYSGLENDLRAISNKLLLKSVIRKKYLSRKNLDINSNLLIPKHEILSLGEEIELVTIKSPNSE